MKCILTILALACFGSASKESVTMTLPGFHTEDWVASTSRNSAGSPVYSLFCNGPRCQDDDMRAVKYTAIDKSHFVFEEIGFYTTLDRHRVNNTFSTATVNHSVRAIATCSANGADEADCVASWSQVNSTVGLGKATTSQFQYRTTIYVATLVLPVIGTQTPSRSIPNGFVTVTSKASLPAKTDHPESYDLTHVEF